MRMIDAELLKHEMITESVRPLLARRNVLQIIDDAPTIDAEPVRRGRWIMDEERPGMFMCSVCFDPWSIDDEETIKGFNYCPNCGAKMEDEE